MLRRVDRFHTVIDDHLTHIHTTLSGTVQVDAPQPGTLLFTEHGTNTATGHATHNTLLWTLREGTLSLAHLRGSPNAPTHLFSTDGRAPPVPHVCGSDTYAASLSALGQHLTLSWLVAGPAKGHIITTRYFAAGDAADTPTHLSR